MYQICVEGAGRLGLYEQAREERGGGGETGEQGAVYVS